MRKRWWHLGVLLLALLPSPVVHAESVASAEALVVQAQDRAFPELGDDESSEAHAVLDAVAWEPGDFEVRVEPVFDTETRSVTFDSPRPSGSAPLDRVRLTWHPAAPLDDAPAALDDGATLAPAVVLVHSLHPQMVVARSLAPTLSRLGVHAFVLELPGYGSRRAPGDRWPGIEVVAHAAQAAADVRRACNAVAALPGIDPQRVVLQGTSLGTYPAAVAAQLDAPCNSVVLLLGGANLVDVLETGGKDAARLRESLDRHGIHANERRALLAPLEPIHLAHRLDPQQTWLLAARFDEVIRPEHADAFAQAVGLDESRYLQLSSNHYTAALALPAIAQLIADVAWERDPLPLNPTDDVIEPGAPAPG